jgi:hypothetical protein
MAILRLWGLWFLAALSAIALAQDVLPPSFVSHPNQEIRVSGLPSLKAVSKDAPDVLATAVAMVLNNKELCCDRDSALEDRLALSDPVSLKSVAAKLQGRQLSSDGRPIQITAEYFDAASINSGKVVGSIAQKHAPLMVWNSNLYVVSGVIYDDAVYSDGSEIYVIRKFLLLDPRFSDSRRNVVFNRDADDLNNVKGMLFLTVSAQ